jgi:hypothetical protein
MIQISTLARVMMTNGCFGWFFHCGNLAGKIGFNPGTLLEVCCGFGGAYNYNVNVTCRDSGNVSLSTGGTQFVNISTAPNPKEHIEWDGVHFTQAAYKVIASFFLSGKFFISPPGFNLKHLCNLDFSEF